MLNKTDSTVISSWKFRCIFPQAALQRCSCIKVFWKYAANLRENTHAKVWFQWISKAGSFIEITLQHGWSPWVLSSLLEKLTGKKNSTQRPFNNFAWINLRKWLFVKHFAGITLHEFCKKTQSCETFYPQKLY